MRQEDSGKGAEGLGSGASASKARGLVWVEERCLGRQTILWSRSGNEASVHWWAKGAGFREAGCGVMARPIAWFSELLGM